MFISNNNVLEITDKKNPIKKFYVTKNNNMLFKLKSISAKNLKRNYNNLQAEKVIFNKIIPVN